MKYLEQYIEEKLKIKVLGKLTTRDSNEGGDVGVSLVIDGYEPGIEVWYVDYATWLEEKLDGYKLNILDEYDELLEKKSPDEYPDEDNKQISLTFEEFRDEVLTAMENKPKDWRDGQFVFNYIDEIYGVARIVQFVDKLDCFYDDSKIGAFIERSYEKIKERRLQKTITKNNK